MSINYTAQIVSVDPTYKVMEVVYTSEGRQPVHVSARMPYVNEDLKAVIDMFSPVQYWEEQDRHVQSVEVGQVIPMYNDPNPERTLEEAKRVKLNELAEKRYLHEIGGTQIYGVTIKTDPASQAKIGTAYSSLKDGLVTSVDWKAADDQWITLDLGGIMSVAQAVAMHVKNSFSMEKALSEQVASATTIEEVDSITWPIL